MSALFDGGLSELFEGVPVPVPVPVRYRGEREPELEEAGAIGQISLASPNPNSAGFQWSSDRAHSRSGSSRSSVKFVTPPKVEISVSKLIELNVIIQRAGPPVRHPSRRLHAIPRDNLLGQIDEGAQARSYVAASWIIEAISGIRGRPLV
jgi:hypothetical protein